MKSKIYGSLILIWLTFSCTQDAEVATFTVSNGDFSNSLLVEGVVEPVRSTTFSSPRFLYDGQVQFLVEDGEMVEEGQLICAIDYPALQNQYEQLTISLEDAEVGLSKTKADLNMQLAILEAQVRTNDADTRIAQMDSLQIAFMSVNQRLIKELELEKASIEKARYEKKLEALKVIQQSEVRKLELEIARLKNRVDAMRDQLDLLIIKASRSGMIIRATNMLTGTKLQVGDPVWGNFPLASMPEFDQMKVKIMATEADFKLINVNDSVSYTFDAMPGNSGTGKILRKTPVGQPYKRGSTVRFFEIEASIDSVLTMPEPGFTANCRIVFKQIENVISVPQIAVFDEDSMKVVFVQRKRGYEKRQILTDVSSLKEIVVTAGLTEGEVIALSRPKPSFVKELIALPDSLINKPDTTDVAPKPENRQGIPPGAVPASPQMITQP